MRTFLFEWAGSSSGFTQVGVKGPCPYTSITFSASDFSPLSTRPDGDPAVDGRRLFLQAWAGVCALVQAFIPPSTVRFAPVMYEDSGPATNATNAATSSTCPKRSSAVAAFCGTAHSVVAGVYSASVGPGCPLFALMPPPPPSPRGGRGK